DKQNLQMARWHCAKFYKEQQFYNQASLILDEIYRSKEHYNYGPTLKELWFCLTKDGQILRARDLATQLLRYYQLTKKTMLGLSFTKELGSYDFPVGVKDYYRISFLLKNGEKKEISEYVESHFAEILSNANGSGADNSEGLCHLIDNELKNWQNIFPLAKFKLNRRLQNLRSLGPGDKKDFSIRKDFIKTLYQLLLNFPADCESYTYLADYVLQFKRNKIAPGLKKWFDKNSKQITPEGIVKFNQTFEVAGQGQEVDEQIDRPEEYDLGTDLFLQTLPQSESKKEKIKKIERDIVFLHKKGEKLKAKKLLVELKNIDENNTLVVAATQLINLTKIKDWDEFSVTEELQGVAKELFEYFHQLWEEEGTEINDDFHRQTKIYFKRYIGHMNREEILPAYRDLVEAFRAIGMPEVSLKILEKVEGWAWESFELKERINVSFLKISLLMENANYHGALALLEDIVHNWPLVIEEQSCFLYLMGEVYRKMDKIDSAKQAYLKVKAINPNYRLVRMRIKELEKSK
ncbi:MAG: hypothetical protein WCG27_11925, partial [Pseudomonadota bacterium]